MKKRIPILFLALVLVFSLSSCGSQDKAGEYAGEYTCTKVSMEADGQELSAAPEEVFDGEVSLILKTDGSAELTLSGEAADAAWKVEGSDFTLSFAGNDSRGTIKENVLEIDILGTGMIYTFEKIK